MKIKFLVLSTMITLAEQQLHAQYSAPAGEWHTWGGDHGFTRYTALDQINADNVKQLQVVWRWKARAGFMAIR